MSRILIFVEGFGREIPRVNVDVLSPSQWIRIESRKDAEPISLEIGLDEKVLLDLEVTFWDLQHVIVVVAFAQFVVPKAFCSKFGGCVEEGGDGTLKDDACVRAFQS